MNAIYLLSSLTLAQVTGGDAAAMQKVVAARSIFGYINAGGFLSYLLVILSIVAVALMIANLVILRREYLAPDHVVDGLEPLMKERNVEAVVTFCRQPQNDSFLSRVISRGLLKIARSQYGMLELKPAIEEAGSRELDRLEKSNQGLAILAAVGPMLGLLGTVIGMIGAFAEIGSASGIAKNEELARYMSLALVCTAEGLVVAIPCTFAYALFKRRTDRLVAEIGDVAERLAGQFAGKHAAPKAVSSGGSGVGGGRPFFLAHLGGRMNLGRRHEFREAGFDLTPMIDVILLLLTFFVMGSQFAQAMRKPMDLPHQSGEPPAPDAARSIIVDMNADGALVLLDGQPVTRPDFVALVRQEMGVSPDGQAHEVELTIRANRACPSLHLNRLAGDLARIGVRKWKVATTGGLGGGVGVKHEGEGEGTP